ncbi:MAG: radical SAM protein [Hyphomicrobiales bacterium]
MKRASSSTNLAAAEIGAIRKNWRGRTCIALVYPNHYHVGMSNLGLQTVYGLLNRIDDVVCERVFLPEADAAAPGRLATFESGRPVAEADIVAFSISFESDYPHLLSILDQARIPLAAAERDERHPLVIAGGVACGLNPEPIAAFVDCFLIGEAEMTLTEFLKVFAVGAERRELLRRIARQVPGAYVPACYRVDYAADGTVEAFVPVADVPEKIARPYVRDISAAPTCSTVVTPHTAFGRSFLVEVGRGCPHGCRFCSAGFVYRPPRFRSAASLAQTIEQGLAQTDRIGLVGAAVSDLPGIGSLCRQFADRGISMSFSSLRADALSPELITALRDAGVKTATIAPEAGSERLRRVINKGISEEDVLNAATALVGQGIPNLKLYFMVGLPTETREDVEAVAILVKRIQHAFLKSSRTRRAIGTITVSVNSFVPKPFTPFQWAGMAEVPDLKARIKLIKAELGRLPNVRVHSDIPRWAYIQALLARGDRRVAEMLLRVRAASGNWAHTLKTVAVNPDFYVLRERGLDEHLPWNFIDHHVSKAYLQDDYRRALQGRPGVVCRVESCRLCGVCDPDRAPGEALKSS